MVRRGDRVGAAETSNREAQNLGNGEEKGATERRKPEA